MKKFMLTLVFLAFILPAVFTPIYAQDSNDRTSDVYYVNVSVEMIYPTYMGYVVLYRTQKGVAAIGIPNRWFSEAAGKAGIVQFPYGQDWPSMSVFYKDHEFSHLRLYVSRTKAHRTWGNMPLGTDISRFFPDDESFVLQF